MTGLVLTSIGVLCASLPLLLAVFLLLAPGPLRAANRYFAGFLVLTAIDLTGWSAALLPPALRPLFVWRIPLAFLQMPCLYVYALALCFPARLTARHWLAGWFAVGAAFLLLAMGFDWAVTAIDMALQVQFYGYIGLLIVLLRRYRSAYAQSESRADTVTFQWLATVVIVSFAAHALVLAKSIARLSNVHIAGAGLEITVGLVAVLITFALTFTALLRQDLFVAIAVEPEPAPERVEEIVAFAADPAEMERIQAYMQEHEPFLEAALTIRALSRKLGMGQRDLSQLLNQGLGVHFFDFVNRFRVEKAAALLLDPSKADLSVLEIAYQVGFNTKSSFNTAFNKHVGQTPTAYRRSAAAGAGKKASD